MITKKKPPAINLAGCDSRGRFCLAPLYIFYGESISICSEPESSEPSKDPTSIEIAKITNEKSILQMMANNMSFMQK